jgi:hypothetical protein
MKAKSFAVSALIIGLGIYLIFRFSSSGKEEKEEGITCDPPDDINGSGIPVTGRRPIFIPTFTQIWIIK